MRIRVRVNGVEGGATLSIGAEAGVKTESELVAAAATKLLGVDPAVSACGAGRACERIE